MRKSIKIIIISLVVAAIVGCALYFILRKKEVEEDTSLQISTMIYSEGRKEFNAEFEKMSENLNESGSDDRIEIVLEVNQNLDNVVWSLLSDYVSTETKVYNSDIAKSFDELKESQTKMLEMMKEYNKKVEIDEKKSQPMFNRNVGANDFFEQACQYLSKYASFAIKLNENLNSNKAQNAKFNVFEVYCRIVNHSFSEIKEDGKLIQLKDYDAVSIFNGLLNIDGINMNGTGMNLYSECVNMFNKYYSECDKNLMAKEFESLYNQVTSATQETKEGTAMFYLKAIFNV